MKIVTEAPALYAVFAEGAEVNDCDLTFAEAEAMVDDCISHGHQDVHIVQTRRETVPVELVEALKEYLERHPEKKEISIHSSSGKSVLMGDIPKEIEMGTELGLHYEKALYKMAFEDLLSGRKTL